MLYVYVCVSRMATDRTFTPQGLTYNPVPTLVMLKSELISTLQYKISLPPANKDASYPRHLNVETGLI